MNWPALSSDLNPIEHLWDEIQRRLNKEHPCPPTAAERSVAFRRVWARIPIAFINRLVNSMYRRCAAEINAGGGHTRY
jgi:transposase